MAIQIQTTNAETDKIVSGYSIEISDSSGGVIDQQTTPFSIDLPLDGQTYIAAALNLPSGASAEQVSFIADEYAEVVTVPISGLPIIEYANLTPFFSRTLEDDKYWIESSYTSENIKQEDGWLQDYGGLFTGTAIVQWPDGDLFTLMVESESCEIAFDDSVNLVHEAVSGVAYFNLARGGDALLEIIGDYPVRLSLYKGYYEGPYIPYNDNYEGEDAPDPSGGIPDPEEPDIQDEPEPEEEPIEEPAEEEENTLFEINLEALNVAALSSQHFFTDDEGAHVVTLTQERQSGLTANLQPFFEEPFDSNYWLKRNTDVWTQLEDGWVRHNIVDSSEGLTVISQQDIPSDTLTLMVEIRNAAESGDYLIFGNTAVQLPAYPVLIENGTTLLDVTPEDADALIAIDPPPECSFELRLSLYASVPESTATATGTQVTTDGATRFPLQSLSIQGTTPALEGINLTDDAEFGTKWTNAIYIEEEKCWQGSAGQLTKVRYDNLPSRICVEFDFRYISLSEAAAANGIYVGFRYTDGTTAYVRAQRPTEWTRYSFTSAEDKVIDFIQFGYNLNITCQIRNVMIYEWTESPGGGYIEKGRNPGYIKKDSLMLVRHGKNLMPYFAHTLQNPLTTDWYWSSLTAARITFLEDGWAHIEIDNTAGTSSQYAYFDTRIFSFVKDVPYIAVLEVRNFACENAMPWMFVSQTITGQLRREYDYVANGTRAMRPTADGTYQVMIAGGNIGEAYLGHGYFGISAGGLLKLDARLALYEAETSGNLVDNSALTNGYLNGNATGTILAPGANNEKTTDFIPLGNWPQIQILTDISDNPAAQWVAWLFYDADKKPIGSRGGGSLPGGANTITRAMSNIYEVPEGAAYIRVSFRSFTDGTIRVYGVKPYEGEYQPYYYDTVSIPLNGHTVSEGQSVEVSSDGVVTLDGETLGTCDLPTVYNGDILEVVGNEKPTITATWATEVGYSGEYENYYKTVGKPDGGYNSLWNSRGIFFRKAQEFISTWTESALSFYDGLGNNAENVLAQFGLNLARIGKEAETHVDITSNGFSVMDDAETQVAFMGQTTQTYTLAEAHIYDAWAADSTYHVTDWPADETLGALSIMSRNNGAALPTELASFPGTEVDGIYVYPYHYDPTTGDISRPVQEDVASLPSSEQANVLAGLQAIWDGAIGGISSGKQGVFSTIETSQSDCVTYKSTQVYSHVDIGSPDAYMSALVANTRGRSQPVLRVYNANDENGYGDAVVIGDGGLVVVGAGESATNVYARLLKGQLGSLYYEPANPGTEQLHLSSDGAVYVHANCNTPAAERVSMFSANGNIYAAPATAYIGEHPTANNGGTGFYLRDLFGDNTGCIHNRFLTTGTLGTEIYVTRKINDTAEYNALNLWIDDNGKRTVTVTEAAPWRTALGLGSLATKSSVTQTQTVVTASATNSAAISANANVEIDVTIQAPANAKLVGVVCCSTNNANLVSRGFDVDGFGMAGSNTVKTYWRNVGSAQIAAKAATISVQATCLQAQNIS